MKKEEFKQLGKLFLAFAVILGAVISILTLAGSNESLRKYLAGIFITLIALFGAGSLMDSETGLDIVSETGSELVEVVRVIDGDTLEIDNGSVVRLLGIDSPERDECYYSEAKQALNELVLGENVKLEKDIFGTDNFGRLLRYVFLPEGDFINDVFVNDYLLEQGFANTLLMSNSQKYRDILIHSRNEAVTDERGMWGACEQELEEEMSTFETNDPPPNPDCVIKGNISEHGYGKTYFFPGCPNYKRVKIDFEKGDRYFCTKGEAEVAGFKMAEGCNY
ncbi:MAG: thermonuclease family protein [Candidatus Pacebacteria bacterium]|nr:thermonuclease family protein [Candidatus Paceibacterota bacterium]